MKHLRRLALMMAALLLVGMLPLFPAEAEKSLQYWIGVDVLNQRTTIYRTSDNSVVHRWLCTTGMRGKDTPVGTYHLPAARGNERKEWFSFTRTYVKYAVRYTRRLYFHSVLFRAPRDNAMIASTLRNLGHRGSAGCVRLEVAHAKWVCDNCPTGTLVIIHKGVDDPLITTKLGGNAGLATTPSLPPPPVVTGLTLDHTGTVTLNKGETLQLNCTVQPAEATTALRWKTSKKKYVTVSENGLVTAKRHGTAIITVTASNGVKTSVKIVSVDPTIARSVTLDRSGTVTLNKGETLQLNATVVPGTAATALKWKSSKPRRASVDRNGLVTALKPGVARITVTTANKKKAVVNIRVVDPTLPTRVTISEGSPITLRVGESISLTPKLAPDTAVTTFTWRSSKNRVARVDRNGKVTAYRTGTAKITVRTANKKKATIVVKVIK